MKEFFKELGEKYLEIFGIAILIIAAISYGAFVLSPIILSIVFLNGWYILLYIIVGPIVSVLNKE